MKKYWLIFAQAATAALGVLMVIALFKPGMLNWREPSNGIIIEQVKGRVPAQASGSFANAAQAVTPSVVNVFTQKKVREASNPFASDPIFRHFFGDRVDPRPRQVSNLGSGVIVTTNGYILTNNHVVEAADEIQVALADGKIYPAKVVGADPETDLAVLKINATKLPAIVFGRSESLRVGDWVLAIGNPFGVGQTVTLGIVSALGRSHLGINTFENFIQTDAAINPGNSGGALVDAAGNLVGINSAIYSRTGGSQGIGFAIPANLAKQVMEQIIKNGSVTRGWVGIEVQDLSPEIAESFNLKSTEGALIAGVLKGGPADAAGIKPGDILLAVEGKPVSDSSTLLNLIAGLQPGTEAHLTLGRGATRVEVSVKVARRPRVAQPEQDNEALYP
ncbi:MAG: Do family serine endopeptidase [Thiobacillaceae bacterium]